MLNAHAATEARGSGCIRFAGGNAPLVTQYQHAVHKRFLVDLWFAWSSPSGGRFANGR